MLQFLSGPYGDCFDYIDQEAYYDACVYDLCHTDPGSDVICGSLQEYAQQCREANAIVGDWRALFPECGWNFLGESDPSTLSKKGIFNKNVCQGHKSRVCLCAKSDVQDIFKSYKNPFLAGRQNLFSLTKTTVISVAKRLLKVFLMIMNCWAFLLCICVLGDCMGASRVIINF